MSITDLRCENLVEPIGIGRRNPEFSWRYEGHPRARQAFRIRTDRWDSGSWHEEWDSDWQDGARLRQVRHRNIEETSQYRWRVAIRFEDGSVEESGYARFESALFEASGWQAKWITGGARMRHGFHLRGEMRSARLHYTGLGYVEAYLNGVLVGDGVLEPTYTDYRKRCEYMVRDVTSLLRAGWNAAGIQVCGHWPMSSTRTFEGDTPEFYWNGPLMAILQLRVEYVDGTSEIIATGDGWKVSEGPVVRSSIYGGEDYDARRETPGWCSTGFEDSGWGDACICEGPGGRLQATSIPGIRVVEEIEPRSIRRMRDGRIVLDFGQNLAGWLKIRVTGPRGHVVTLRHSELLHDDGTLNTDNLRSATSTDRYTLHGEGEETYHPRFTYHGFRYAEIEGWPGAMEPEAVIAQVIHTCAERSGSFRCSDPLLQRIHEMMVWTQRTNMQGIPTDCCQRDERQGWLGDVLAVSEGSLSNFDLLGFYRKVLEDIRDTQRADGSIAAVYAPGWGGESFIWKSAYHFLLRTIHSQYGDRRSVEEHYPALLAYASYLEGVENEDGLLTGEDFGDWLSIENARTETIRDAFYVDYLHAMAGFAALVGTPGDTARFREKWKRTREVFHRVHYTLAWNGEGTGCYGIHDRTASLPGALSLLFEIVPVEKTQEVADRLVWEVAHSRGSPQLATGIIGTRFVVEALSSIGRDDLTLSILRRREYPSFGFMLDHGATTVWERWQYLCGNGMNSHNHSPLAGVDAWFYKALGGIRSLEPLPQGGCRLHFRPFFGEGLDWIDCERRTPWGTIHVRWERMDGHIAVTAEFPSDCEIVHESIGQDGQKLELGAGRNEWIVQDPDAVDRGRYICVS